MTPTTDKPVRRIGGWHFAEVSNRGEGRYPESLDAEQREIQSAVRSFIENEVTTRLEELDADCGGPLMPDLLKQLGDLGFFQAEIPESDGGMGLGLFGAIPLIEELGRGGSFHVAAMVHQGIGTQPIAYYGNDEQRAAYLPDAMSCARFGAYALTEPSSGSDALAMKTTAVRDGDHWILNGAKQFITNAGWASYFVVFGRVDGDKITAFVVDRGVPGFEVLAEEHKMGIKGSSTCALKLTNVRVPDSRRLGEVGVGHKIALNLLNLGRLKLGTTVLGANKRVLREAVRYAMERKQFHTRICDFGMTRMKIAECAALIFAGEAIAFRTAGMIEDAAHATDGGPTYEAKIGAADAFSPECAMTKIHLSEGGCVVADHGVQILGGYGFVEEYPTARAYRDARIARLYEGTNEINRLHIVNTILRRASKGEMGAGWLDRLTSRELESDAPREGLEGLRAHVEAMKDIFGAALGSVLASMGGDSRGLKNEQELTWHLADIAIEVYAAESSMLRAEAIADHAGSTDKSRLLAEEFARAAVGRCNRIVRDRATTIIGHTAEDSRRFGLLAGVSGLSVALGSTLDAERAVAQAIVDGGGEWPEFAGAR